MVAMAPAARGQRDAAVTALVGMAHYSSHVMQLALPPLFPILHGEFGVGFTELGLIVTLFYVASGLGQAAAGILVDRYGAQRLLVAGVAVLALSILLAGLVGSYWMLLPLAVIGGLGNSVFHPADLSILSHRVSEGRLGRAYAAHSIAGTLGYATSPVLIAAVAAYGNWRLALGIVGIAGLSVALVLYINRSLLIYAQSLASRPTEAGQRRPGYLQVVGSPVVLMAFAYFAMTAFAGSGLQTFSITALVSGYGVLLKVATLGLTGYLVGSAGGMVLGGFLADRTRHHHRVAMSGIAVAAALMLLMSALAGYAPAVVPVMMLAGIANGITAPSRDVLIRRAAAGAGMGSVFGFVYSGFDLGSSTAPLLFGALLDHHAPHAVFIAVACAFALAVPTVMQVQHRAAARRQATAGAD
ncbi:MAG TPA: MFS transporter [Stellaceae bacterium]|nr:MFS transporter [Stellaceae bacterium]